MLLEKIGFWLLHSFKDTHYFRKLAERWEDEKEMDLWFADRFKQFASEKDLSYHQESMAGGGMCEHFINSIPIEDKIIDKSDCIEMEDFLEEQYRIHYPQARQYALGESKYAIILITDRRSGVKNGNIRVSSPLNCILFRKDEKDNIWCGVFVFQVFLKSPSRLKNPKFNK